MNDVDRDAIETLLFDVLDDDCIETTVTATASDSDNIGANTVYSSEQTQIEMAVGINNENVVNQDELVFSAENHESSGDDECNGNVLNTENPPESSSKELTSDSDGNDDHGSSQFNTEDQLVENTAQVFDADGRNESTDSNDSREQSNIPNDTELNMIPATQENEHPSTSNPVQITSHGDCNEKYSTGENGITHVTKIIEAGSLEMTYVLGVKLQPKIDDQFRFKVKQNDPLSGNKPFQENVSSSIFIINTFIN